MRILGIESSCDETSASIIDIDPERVDVLCNVISSQMGIHKEYGGVVPEVAARNHATNILPVVRKALESTSAGDGSDLDLIAVTSGPGLMTSLLIGVQSAETLGFILNKPVVGVNHLEGHVLSPLLEHASYPIQEDLFPLIVMTVSGGHTQIVLMRGLGSYEQLGTTIDDAAGEAFDKVAKMMGLGYPGGPQIDKLAVHGNPQAFDFPRPMLQFDHYQFSFSGLKTAVKYTIRDLGGEKVLTDEQKADIAASFQRAVVDVLVKKTMRAVKSYGAHTLFVAGGVAANRELRGRFEYEIKQQAQARLVLVDRKYTGDNAAMIALAGYFQWQGNKKQEVPVIVNPKMSL